MRDSDEFDIYNNSATDTIPAFSVVRGMGFQTSQQLQGAIKVDIPNADNATGMIVTGQFAILPLSYGIGTMRHKCIVSYNAADGTPAVGDEWGVKSGSYQLRKNFSGFLMEGGNFNGVCNAFRKYTSGGSMTLGLASSSGIASFDTLTLGNTWINLRGAFGSGYEVTIPTAGTWTVSAMVTVSAILAVFVGTDFPSVIFRITTSGGSSVTIAGGVALSTNIPAMRMYGTSSFNASLAVTAATLLQLEVYLYTPAGCSWTTVAMGSGVPLVSPATNKGYYLTAAQVN